MSELADLFVNKIGRVMVLAPTPHGRLRHLVEERYVVLERGGERVKASTRWIFGDFPRGTLKDDWGNPFDHQVHHLLAGTMAEGAALVSALEAEGLSVSEEENLFVPFQTLDVWDLEGSDELRHRHARAFAIARRERVSARDIVTSLRDSMVARDL